MHCDPLALLRDLDWGQWQGYGGRVPVDKENLQYGNWIPGEPNNDYGSEDCVRICDNGLWNGVGYDTSSNIICEKDL